VEFLYDGGEYEDVVTDRMLKEGLEPLYDKVISKNLIYIHLRYCSLENLLKLDDEIKNFDGSTYNFYIGISGNKNINKEYIYNNKDNILPDDLYRHRIINYKNYKEFFEYMKEFKSYIEDFLAYNPLTPEFIEDFEDELTYDDYDPHNADGKYLNSSVVGSHVDKNIIHPDAIIKFPKIMYPFFERSMNHQLYTQKDMKRINDALDKYEKEHNYTGFYKRGTTTIKSSIIIRRLESTIHKFGFDWDYLMRIMESKVMDKDYLFIIAEEWRSIKDDDLKRRFRALNSLFGDKS
jgi:hypothetical protein